jgi:hypothetical protein
MGKAPPTNPAQWELKLLRAAPALLGVLYFSVVLLAWVLSIILFGTDTLRSLLYALEHAAGHIPQVIGLLVLFAAASRAAWNGHAAAWLLLALGIAAASGCFAYDMLNERYQLGMMTAGQGCEHHYITWPWWDDRIWPR